jgi:hypothetical protein
MAHPAIDPVSGSPDHGRPGPGSSSERDVPSLAMLDVLGRGPEDVLFDDEGPRAL